MVEKTEIEKAAAAHQALLIEKIDAIKKIADKLNSDMDPKDLQVAISNLNDLSWKVSSDAKVVNIAKAAPAELEKAHDDAKALIEKIAATDTLTAEHVEAVKALSATVAALKATSTTGAGGGTQQAGPGGKCECPQCHTKVDHKQAQACTDMKCPKCGAAMQREGYEPKKGDGDKTEKDIWPADLSEDLED